MAKKEGKKRGINLQEVTAHIQKVRSAHFLGIGIDDYLHFPKLANAVKDVKDIAETLITQYQFDPEHVMLLLNEQATRVGIVNKLDDLVNLLSKENDLIIYYSGHGHLNPQTQRGFWIPYDAQQGTTADFIPNATIKGYMEDIPAFHTFLISDSCFSGSLFVQGKMRSAKEAISELDNRASRWALCSGRHDEEVYDGDPGENSPFAKSILGQLRQSQHSELNVGRLVNEVIMQTRAHYRQLPEGNPMFDVGHQGGQFIFRLKYDDERDWAGARAAGTVAVYENYLSLYPEGKYAREAALKLLELRDDEAWRLAQDTNTLLAYDQYLEQFPEGRHGAEAIAAIRGFNEAEDWRRAEQDNELWKYREYLRKYSDGQFVEQAKAAIDALRSKEGDTEETRPVLSRPAAPGGKLASNLEQYRAWYFLGGAILVLSSVLLALYLWPRSSKQELPAVLKPDEVEQQYDFVNMHPDYGSYYAIRKTDKWGFYNPNTGFMIPPRYDTVYPFAREMALVRQSGLFGWIDKFGKEVIPIRYQEAERFDSVGLAQVTLEGVSFQIDRSGQRLGEEEALGGGGERAAFEAVLDSNTVRVYRAFLAEYPNGNFAAEARQKIEILDQEAWRNAVEANRYALYVQYLNDFPQGAHRAEAEEARKGFVPDARDGRYYRVVTLNGRLWMAENLKYEASGQCYRQDTLNCQLYGRLYTWQEAQTACPEGWALPGDNEWWEMAAAFGRAHSFSRNNSSNAGAKAYEDLMSPAQPGFAALLGGRRASDFRELNAAGYYWSSLRDQRSGDVIVYVFDGEKKILTRTTARPNEALSCRCVKQ
jgi:uncharacterized protein (TIGR02145 family)